MFYTKHVCIILGRRGYLILSLIITLETQALLLLMGNLDVLGRKRDPDLETHNQIFSLYMMRFCFTSSSPVESCLALDCGWSNHHVSGL